MLDKLGDLGEAIIEHIDRMVEARVAEMIEPVLVLREFKDVYVLILDEVVEILRSSKDKIRDACLRGELPHVRLGRDVLFPKKLMAEYLMGIWKPDKAKTKSYKK